MFELHGCEEATNSRRAPWSVGTGFGHQLPHCLNFGGAQGDVWLLAAIAILGEHRLCFGFEG